MHYGDITMTFLNNWFAADARGTALTYASAVAVEEKSVIDYNLGNPDGVLSPGEEPRVPRDPLVAIYPEEGTLFSDNPFIVLDTEWVDADEKAAAALFEEFVQLPENQQKVLEFGFRPNNPSVAARPTRSSPPTASIPNQPTAELRGAGAGRARRHPRLVGRAAQGGAGPARARHLRARWATRRTTGRTKLDLAKEAAVSALDAVQGHRRGRAVGVQHRARRARSRTCASWCRSARSASSSDAARRADRGPVPDQRDAALRRHRAGVRDDARRRTTRARSTPSCCSPTARTTTATPPTTTSSSPS